jgi:hypothetical protein
MSTVLENLVFQEIISLSKGALIRALVTVYGALLVVLQLRRSQKILEPDPPAAAQQGLSVCAAMWHFRIHPTPVLSALSPPRAYAWPMKATWRSLPGSATALSGEHRDEAGTEADLAAIPGLTTAASPDFHLNQLRVLCFLVL